MAHAKARIGTRTATGGREAARTAGASPSEARARRALAPGVGEPEATQYVSCKLIILEGCRGARPMSTPVESPLGRVADERAGALPASAHEPSHQAGPVPGHTLDAPRSPLPSSSPFNWRTVNRTEPTYSTSRSQT